jgi:hypothetical protein
MQNKKKHRYIPSPGMNAEQEKTQVYTFTRNECRTRKNTGIYLHQE